MDGFHRGDEKLEGFSEVSRLEGAGAFLSERHIVGHDGGPEDVISREGEKLGHPAASAPEFQESGAGGEAEGLEGLEESSKFPAVLRPRLGSPEGFPSVGVEVGLLGSAGHGVVKTDLGLVGSGLVVEGGGEEAVRVISEDGVATGLEFAELRQREVVVLLIGLEETFAGREEEGFREPMRKLVGERSGGWHQRRRSFDLSKPPQ